MASARRVMSARSLAVGVVLLAGLMFIRLLLLGASIPMSILVVAGCFALVFGLAVFVGALCRGILRQNR